MKMSSYSYRCGSTILVVIMTLLTLCICGILYIPTLILKILWIALSIFITLYLWANNKCDFIQKFVVVNPSYSEVEVAFIGGKEYLNDDTVYFEQRKDTFIRYCKEHQISYEPYLKETEFSADAGYQMMMELIEAGTLPSAVFAASDPIAIGAMRALYQKGYRIPEDISVMGFDDINVAKFSNPPLTTVHAPADFMGQFAAHYIQLLAESNTKLSYNMPVRMTLPCEITIRDTCGASSDL